MYEKHDREKYFDIIVQIVFGKIFGETLILCVSEGYCKALTSHTFMKWPAEEKKKNSGPQVESKK